MEKSIIEFRRTKNNTPDNYTVYTRSPEPDIVIGYSEYPKDVIDCILSSKTELLLWVKFNSAMVSIVSLAWYKNKFARCIWNIIRKNKISYEQIGEIWQHDR